MVIKASRITNLTDARYFAAREVDFLGFNLEEGTASYLDPVYVKAIREWVEGPGIVGEFSRAPVSVVREAAAFYGLDAVQVTGAYAGQLAVLKGLTVIMTLESGPDTGSILRLLEAAKPFVAWFLVGFSSAALTTEETAFWSKCCKAYPILIETEAAAGQVPELVRALGAAGLSLAGGEEEQVGVKSFDDIEEIFEALGR
ncbi:MAG: hypothetical protein IPK76_04205 [Lewinellaceae bacterium]|jgi:phosphoribosylanthranilate isomerase|nr:hypothetical protein [Lewinellaceae bacterium]